MGGHIKKDKVCSLGIGTAEWVQSSPRGCWESSGYCHRSMAFYNINLLSPISEGWEAQIKVSAGTGSGEGFAFLAFRGLFSCYVLTWLFLNVCRGRGGGKERKKKWKWEREREQTSKLSGVSYVVRPRPHLSDLRVFISKHGFDTWNPGNTHTRPLTRGHLLVKSACNRSLQEFQLWGKSKSHGSAAQHCHYS